MKIVGIDPGSTNLGIAILGLDKDFKIETIHAYNISAKEEYDKRFNHRQAYGDLRAGSRMALIMDAMMPHFSEDMVYVSIEAGFYNAFRPAAYAVLLAQMKVITSRLDCIYPYVSKGSYPPGVIKKKIGVKNHKGKDPVLDAIKALGFEKYLQNDTLDNLSEHAVDAIGIAYTGYLDHI